MLQRISLALLCGSVAVGTHAQDKKGITALDDQKFIDGIYKTALTESSVYPWLENLCLDIGHRLSGSPAADKAVDYSVKTMQEAGLKATKQPVMVPVWQRGEPEVAYYKTSNGKGELHLLALGGSVATPGEMLTAPIVEVETWDDLKKLGEAGVKGKIVFFNEHMADSNLYTFHSYGHCVKHRWGGAVEAAKYGAVGAVVRSLNLRIDDFPHTGTMTYEGAVDTIPAAAISTRDAETLHKLLASGQRVEMFWKQSCRTLPDKMSYNVVGEIKGTEKPNEIILLGGHLDSWDVGHGAHDDGAGVMQSLGAYELLKKMGYQPKRTIRVVFFMNEENGLRGAKQYAEEAQKQGVTHIAAIESDRGGFTPRGFHVEGDEVKVKRIISWKPTLEKYGLHQLEEGGSGADIKPLQTENNVMIGFVPDSQRYFDHHHSTNDTFEHVNKRELELGTASIAALVYLMDKYGL